MDNSDSRKDIPGIMDPIPRECKHEWVFLMSYNYEMRSCKLCGRIEIKGPGGWSEAK